MRHLTRRSYAMWRAAALALERAAADVDGLAQRCPFFLANGHLPCVVAFGRYVLVIRHPCCYFDIGASLRGSATNVSGSS